MARSNAGYKIIASSLIGRNEFVIGYNENAVSRWVIWKYISSKDEYVWGKYYSDRDECMAAYMSKLKFFLREETFYILLGGDEND